MGTQYFDDSGDVLTAGYIQFYASGTSTPIDTYADVNLTIENEWPVPLDAAGRQPNIFFDGTAKATLRNSAGSMIATADPVGETGSIFGAPWSAAEVYQSGDTVLADDGSYYVSIADSNLNHYPPSNPLWWTKRQFLNTWNASVTYGDNEIVELDGVIYTSEQAANLNHNPSSDAGTWWGLPVRIATQALMEAAVHNASVVTPANINGALGVAKAWLIANGAGTSILASHNITSITDDGTGLLTVTIATDFSSANYPILPAVNGSGDDIFVSVSAQAAGTFSLRCRSPGGGTLVDPTFYYAGCFGDQT